MIHVLVQAQRNCVCVCVCSVRLGNVTPRIGKKTTWFIAFSLWVQCSLHVFAASLWVAFTEHGQHGPESLGRQSTHYNQMQPGSSGIKVLIQGRCPGWKRCKSRNVGVILCEVKLDLPLPRCYPIPAPGWWRSWTWAAGSWGHRSLRRMIKLTMLGTLRPILRDWDKHRSALLMLHSLSAADGQFWRSIQVNSAFGLQGDIFCDGNFCGFINWCVIVFFFTEFWDFPVRQKKEHTLPRTYVASVFSTVHIRPYAIIRSTPWGGHTMITTSACCQSSPVVNSVEMEPLSFPFLKPLTDTS